MRTVTLIIVHCSAVRPDQTSSAAQIDTWHRRYPRALIVGHHDLNPRKACPCIDNVAKEYADLQPAVQPH